MTAVSGGVFRKDLYYDNIGYVPHPGQVDLHYTPSRFKVISNGRRWGKTMFGARELEPNAFVACPVTGEPQLMWIVGPQYTDAEKEFKLIFDSLRKQGIDRDAIKWQNNRESGALHIITSWGFELIGKSAKHPDTLVGDGLNGVLMVEAGRHHRRTWGEYIRPGLSDKRGWAVFTGVPEGRSDKSLLYSLWSRGQDNTKPSWRSWRRPSWTNTMVFPGGRQDPEILEAEDDLTVDEFNRQYGAQFVDKVGAVMNEWEDEIHLRNLAYDPSWPLYGAVDYGFTNPFVWLWIQIGPFGDIRVIRERRWTQKDTPEICKEMLDDPIDAAYVRSCVAFYPDPAEPDDTLTCSRMLRIPSRGGTGGELKTRLQLIRRALKIKPELRHLDDSNPEKIPTLTVDHSCQQLAWEMREGYRWPEHRSEIRSETEHPMDKDNHGPEALGRFFKGYFGVTGERQSTRIGRAVMS
jgi:hypothetical protein